MHANTLEGKCRRIIERFCTVGAIVLMWLSRSRGWPALIAECAKICDWLATSATFGADSIRTSLSVPSTTQPRLTRAVELNSRVSKTGQIKPH